MKCYSKASKIYCLWLLSGGSSRKHRTHNPFQVVLDIGVNTRLSRPGTAHAPTRGSNKNVSAILHTYEWSTTVALAAVNLPCLVPCTNHMVRHSLPKCLILVCAFSMIYDRYMGDTEFIGDPAGFVSFPPPGH